MSTKTVWRWFSLLVVLSLVFGMATAAVNAQPARPENPSAPIQQPPQPQINRISQIPPSRIEEIPPEIAALFEHGMTVEEFILLNNGWIPHALEPFVDREVAVIVELEAPPLAAKLVEKGGIGTMSASAQREYVETLLKTQKELEPKLKALGARVISRYQKVNNVSIGPLNIVQTYPPACL